MPNPPRWWKLTFTDKPTLNIDRLLELGASGIEQTPTCLACFLEADQVALELFVSAAANDGFELIQSTPVEDKNWVQECAEIWQPVQVGKLSIVPFLDSADIARAPAAGEIFLIPSTGFGTGHHESTRLALQLLQHDAVQAQSPQSVLDVGTGSAILALAAVALYRAQVDAVEIDALSLENASANVSINSAGGAIKLFHGGIEQAKGSYNLILANIYAEVLCGLATGITACAGAGAMLVVSGILEDLYGNVRGAYGGEWTEIAVINEGRWVAALWKKVG